MEDYKDKFLQANNFKDSITKSYKVVFKKMYEAECEVQKDLKDFSYDDILATLYHIKSTSYQSINLKWSLIKKYMDFYGNLEFEKITQSDLEKYIDTSVSKYTTREILLKAIEGGLENPQDKAIVMLLFEGVMGVAYSDLLTLRTDAIDFEENTIQLNGRILDIHPTTTEILKLTRDTDTYTKFEVSGVENKCDVEHKLNMASPYIIKSKPNKNNKQGFDPMKTTGIKSRLAKIIDSIGMKQLTGLSIYHSGLIEKLILLEDGGDRKFVKSDVSHYLNRLGVAKCEPNTLLRAMRDLKS